MPENSLQTAARLARRMPGYRSVRRRVVPLIRQSAAARALVHRIFPSPSNGSEPPVDVAPGRLLAGLGVEQLPVVLVSLVGLSNKVADHAVTAKMIDAVIDEVAEMQLLGAGFRPVFLLGTPAFNRPRSYGYVAELVTPCSAWTKESAKDWSEYVGERIASMRASYGVSAMISVGPDGLDEVTRGILRSFG